MGPRQDPRSKQRHPRLSAFSLRLGAPRLLCIRSNCFCAYEGKPVMRGGASRMKLQRTRTATRAYEVAEFAFLASGA
jgi:hypothetical protein